MKKRSFIILSLIILLSFQILAVDIQLRKGGQELDYVSYGPIENVDVNIILDPGFLELIVDLTSLYANSISLTGDSSECSEASGVFRCVVRRDIRILNGMVIITGTVDDVSFEVVKNFNIDNDAPVLNSITTDYCLADKCYLKPGPGILYLDISEGGSGLDNANIWLSILGSQVKAYLCEGNICKVAVTVPETNLFMPAIIPWKSTDDAGNVITGLSSETIYVDREAPTILSVELSTASDIDYFRTSDVIGVEVMISEGSTEPSLIVDASNFNAEEVQGSCVLMGGDWKCTASFSSGYDYSVESTIDIKVSDTVGNFIVQEESINILGLTGDVVPSNWNLISVQQGPERINANNLILDRNIHAFVKISSSSSEIIDIEKQVDCLSGGAEGAENSDLREMMIVDPSPGKTAYYIKGLLANREGYPDITFVNYSCKISVLSKTGGLIESNYEDISFSIEISFDRSLLLDELMQKKLEDSAAFSEKYASLIEKATLALDTMRLMCGAGQGLTGAGAVLGGAGAIIQPVKPEIGTSMITAGQAVADTGEQLNPFCNMINCALKIDKTKENIDANIDDWPGVSQLKLLAGSNEMTPVLDPYKSIFVAAYTKCIPALVSHAESWLAIECSRTSCIQQSAYLGMPPNECDRSYSYNGCMYVSSSILNTIPQTALIKEFGRKLSAIAENPWNVISATAITIGCKAAAAGSPGNVAQGLCVSVNGLGRIAETANLISTMKDKWTNPSIASQCTGMLDTINLDEVLWYLPTNSPNLDNLCRSVPVGGGSMDCCLEGCRKGNLVLQVTPSEDGKGNKPVIGDYEWNRDDLEVFISSSDGTLTEVDLDSAWESMKDAGIVVTNTQGQYVFVDQVIPADQTLDATLPDSLVWDGQDYWQTIDVVETTVGEKTIDTTKLSEGARNLLLELGIMDSNGKIDSKNKLNLYEMQKEAMEYKLEAFQIAMDEYGISEDDIGELMSAYLNPSFDEELMNDLKEINEDMGKIDGITYDDGTRTVTLTPFINRKDDLSNIRDIAIKVRDEGYDPTVEEIALIEEVIPGLNIFDTDSSVDEIDEQITEHNNDLETLRGLQSDEKEKIDELNDDIDGQREDALEDLRILSEYQQVWGGWNAWRSFLNVGLAVSTVTQFFDCSDVGVLTCDGLSEFRQWIEPVSQPEKMLCSAMVHGSISSEEGAVMVSSGAGLVPGAYIYASKSEVLPDGSIDYLVSVFVLNAKKDGLRFNIVLEDPGSEVLDVGGGLGTDEIVLLKDQNFDRSRSGAIYTSVNRDYEKVCVQFNNPSHELKDYFDAESINNKLCQRIERE